MQSLLNHLRSLWGSLLLSSLFWNSNRLTGEMEFDDEPDADPSIERQVTEHLGFADECAQCGEKDQALEALDKVDQLLDQLPSGRQQVFYEQAAGIEEKLLGTDG